MEPLRAPPFRTARRKLLLPCGDTWLMARSLARASCRKNIWLVARPRSQFGAAPQAGCALALSFCDVSSPRPAAVTNISRIPSASELSRIHTRVSHRPTFKNPSSTVRIRARDRARENLSKRPCRDHAAGTCSTCARTNFASTPQGQGIKFVYKNGDVGQP